MNLLESGLLRKGFLMIMDKKQLLEQTDLFVLDMDGTFYLGDNILPGALSFIDAVNEKGKDYLFFTNNASTRPEAYIDKLAGMGCFITRDKIMTSGDVMIRFLKSKYPGQSVYLLGTKPLINSFEDAGIKLDDKHPDIVVASFDKTLTYEKLERACTFIREGAAFLATHMDINCPVEGGFIPDCGAICAAISLSTGKEPRYVGKPFVETVDMILDKTGYNRENVTFVGDRLYTDVATGVNNGARGVLVLTGETKLSDVDASDTKPDAIYDSIAQMGQLMLS
ncbi:HAD-IIA family hydrolase [Butyrivibrio sp.]|uniref:HAD-IIA family hydrolase n=1 Tax=Butyrivibrio sp. TaxID=28121 RepID=UPI0025CF93D9|nr:HAD-IIA family hydrolase [Butyrivibrio sp.]